MGKVHYLKIAEDYADSIACGNKTYEVRYNDRDYQKGDIIEFKVMCRGSDYDRKLGHWLDGKQYRITHVHSGLGMAERYVVLGITPMPELCDIEVPYKTREELEKAGEW